MTRDDGTHRNDYPGACDDTAAAVRLDRRLGIGVSRSLAYDLDNAVDEWLARSRPLDADAFQQIRREWCCGPGRPADHPDAGRLTFVRRVEPAPIGRFAARHDTALLDGDGTVRFAAVEAVPVPSGVVPLVVAHSGDADDATTFFHTVAHVVARRCTDATGHPAGDNGGPSP